MTLPKAVVDATEELAALEQHLQAPVEPDPAPDGQTEDVPPAPEPPRVASVDVPQEPPEVPEEKWEHKYRRLQGKYDAELPRLHQQVRELQGVIQHLQQAPPAPPAAPARPPEPEKYVSDEDVANYGEDFVDIQRRITLDATRDVRKQVEELKAQLAQQHVQVQTVSFETRLLEAVPDFKQVNSDPAWFEWLDEFDPLIRGPRRLVAQAAHNQGDVESIKAYVELFKQSRGTPPAPAPKVDRQQELQRQVQPSRASASVPHSGAKKTFTLGEADALFNRIQHLTAQGRIDEAKRLDAEISAAYAEGRISA
ncbi:MAG: hypothetical protein WAT23_20160 [Chromatiaceae bacterium]